MIAELRTFITVSRQGTFSAAGDRIGLTQAAVSGQIKRLEDRLGFALFDRTGRSATLNPAGAKVLARAQEIVALFDALGAPIEEGLERPIQIGAIASVQSSVLAWALARFRQRFAQRRIRVVPGVSLHLLDQIDGGGLDLAIMIKPPFGLPPDLVWRPLRQERYVLAAPVGCPGDDWRELLQTQPFLRYDRASFGGRQVDRFLRGLPFAVTESIEIDDLAAMLAMVGQGLGVALMPMAEIDPPPNVRLWPMDSDLLVREIGVVRSHLTPAAPEIEHLLACLDAAAGDASNGRLGRLYAGHP